MQVFSRNDIYNVYAVTVVAVRARDDVAVMILIATMVMFLWLLLAVVAPRSVQSELPNYSN